MPMYNVQWEMELDAENPKEAAELAHRIHLDKDSIAQFFVVVDGDGNQNYVDLLVTEEKGE